MKGTQKTSFNSFLVIALIVSITIGFLCNYFYQQSPKHSINIEKFQKELISKENRTTRTLDEMKEIIVHSSIDSLIHLPYGNEDISYYVFDKKGLAFWSDNHLDISNISISDSLNWHFTKLPNAYCVSRVLNFESLRLLALIKVKNNYAYENQELINNFADGFDIDKQVQIVSGHKTDKLAVFCSHGNYLFTLNAQSAELYNEVWALIGFFAYSLAFLFFFLIYARTALF